MTREEFYNEWFELSRDMEALKNVFQNPLDDLTKSDLVIWIDEVAKVNYKFVTLYKKSTDNLYLNVVRTSNGKDDEE